MEDVEKLAQSPLVKALVKELRKLQYVDYGPGAEYGICPCCGRPMWDKHNETCEIGNALAPFEGVIK